jgi:hypothetical protein
MLRLEKICETIAKKLHSKHGYCQSLAHRIQRSNPVSANIPDSKIISLSTICQEGEGIALGPHLKRAPT